MPQRYPDSIRVEAEILYVEKGLNFEQVSRATRPLIKELCDEDSCVSVSQLKRWSEEDRQGLEGKSWPEKREEKRAILRQIEREKLLLKRELLDDARRTRDPQKIYAFTRLDKETAAASKRPEEAAAPDIDRPALFLEDMQFIANILKEVDPEGLKVFSRSFDLIVSRFKADHAQTA